ncbi:MAG: response regulator [Deltaproteobacteria bacterium]|nr:MAG: response regulator [Deltaproteobacteria bacterium]
MKILVVDDEHSFGRLLGHTLKRLGHKPVLATHPRDALDQLAPDIDAVITDIDMPEMSGVDLARAILARDEAMPIAFCTGSAPEGRARSEAAALGRVLPKVWTVADVKDVVEDLRRRREAARSTPAPVEARPAAASPVLEAAAAGADPDTIEPAPRARSRRRARRLRVDIPSWDHVLRMCRAAGSRPVRIAVPAPSGLAAGTPVDVSLVLPEEISVKIDGVVRSVEDGGDGRARARVELVGLTADVAGRLQRLAEAEQPTTPRPRLSAYLHVRGTARRGAAAAGRLARGTDRDMRVSDLMRANDRLRAQIDGLAAALAASEAGDD